MLTIENKNDNKTIVEGSESSPIEMPGLFKGIRLLRSRRDSQLRLRTIIREGHTQAALGEDPFKEGKEIFYDLNRFIPFSEGNREARRRLRDIYDSGHVETPNPEKAMEVQINLAIAVGDVAVLSSIEERPEVSLNTAA